MQVLITFGTLFSSSCVSRSTRGTPKIKCEYTPGRGLRYREGGGIEMERARRKDALRLDVSLRAKDFLTSAPVLFARAS